MTRVIWTTWFYHIVFIGAALADYLPPIEWIVFGTAVLLFHAIAVGFDSVYDSLKERIDQLELTLTAMTEEEIEDDMHRFLAERHTQDNGNKG